MIQRYKTLIAQNRMAQGLCPECGDKVDRHDGWGGPNGCSLTDNGVAQRIHQHQVDLAAGTVPLVLLPDDPSMVLRNGDTLTFTVTHTFGDETHAEEIGERVIIRAPEDTP